MKPFELQVLRNAKRALEEYEKQTTGVMIPSTHCRGRSALKEITELLDTYKEPKK